MLALSFSFARRLAFGSKGRLRRILILLCAGFLSASSENALPQTKSANLEGLSQQAAEARDADRLDEAIALYTKALGLQPKWEEGWWSLGTIEYDKDDYAKAAVDFETVIALNASNGTAHAMLGLCQFELGKDELALKNLLAAERLGIRKDDQLRHVALYHLGVLQLRARRFGDAHETLEQLAKDGVRAKELVVAMGETALRLGPREAPAHGTEEAGVIERAGAAEVLLAIKEFERAKQVYAELTKEFPNFPNLHFAFGRLLLETHDTEEAVAEFQRELTRDPNNVSSLLEIAAVRYQVDSQDGLKYAEKAAKLAPELPFAHYLLGLLRLDTGNAIGAVAELEIAQKAFPKEAQVYFSLGNAYARVGRKMEAAKARAEFVRLNAQAAGQSGPTIYGEQPSGVSPEQLRTADRGAPPR